MRIAPPSTCSCCRRFEEVVARARSSLEELLLDGSIDGYAARTLERALSELSAVPSRVPFLSGLERAVPHGGEAKEVEP